MRNLLTMRTCPKIEQPLVAIYIAIYFFNYSRLGLRLKNGREQAKVSLNNAITFEQNSFSKIHELKTFEFWY